MAPILIVSLKLWYTLAIIFVLSKYIYYPNNGKKEYLFTFVLMSATIYFICLLVQKVEVSLGFALGIFAVFGIIRYKTRPISPREMTYIFICAGIAAKNSLLSANENYFDRILLSDVTLLLLAGLLEYYLAKGNMQINKRIVCNRLDLIHPEKRAQLEKELSDSFGIQNIKKIKVGKINMDKNTADLVVYFVDKSSEHIPNTKGY